MKRRILFLGVLAAALIAAVAIFFPTTGSLSKALVSSDDSQRNIALGRVKGLSSDKKNQLIDELAIKTSDTDWQTRRFALYALRKLGAPIEKTLPAILTLLDDSNDAVRREAGIALTEVGASSPRALLNALPGKTSRAHDGLVHALVGMGPAAITELVPWLKSEKAAERVLATSIIGEMTPAPPETKGILSPMLNDPDASVRTKAAIALNIIDPTFADTVPAHIKTIQRGIWDSDTAAAVKALRGLGPKAKTAKEALTTLLKKSDDNLKDKTTGRGAAAGALNAVDPRRNGMTGLLWDLKQKDSLLRYRAAYALSEMPAAEASGALSDLIKAMDDGDLFVRARAVVAAARIGFDKSERLKPQLAKKAGQALNTISDERVAGFSETVRAAMNISPPKADDDDSAERHDAPAPTAP